MRWHVTPASGPLPQQRSATSLQRRRSCRRNLPRGSGWLWIATAAALALVAVVLGLLTLGGDGKPAATPQPPPIEAPVRGATPADEARNLSAWLRRHSA